MEETSEIIQTNLPPVFSKRPRKLKEMTPRFTVAWGRSGAIPRPRLLAQRLTHCTLKPPLVLQRGPGSREEAHSKVTAGMLGRPDPWLGPDSLLGPYPLSGNSSSVECRALRSSSVYCELVTPRDTLITLEVSAISLPATIPAPSSHPWRIFNKRSLGHRPRLVQGNTGASATLRGTDK